VYVKTLYREYTDATFSELKPRPPMWSHLGSLGPVLRAAVGDTIVVTFRNNASFPCSMHPHGVFYTKENEGVPAPNDNMMPMMEMSGNEVMPGDTFVYNWGVPERAGPGPNDPSSIAWMYHSHVNEVRDVNTGLVGVILVSRYSAATNGRPADIDREFVMLFPSSTRTSAGTSIATSLPTCLVLRTTRPWRPWRWTPISKRAT